MDLPVSRDALSRLAAAALEEDLGAPVTEPGAPPGDLTTDAAVPGAGDGRAVIRAKAEGVIAGGFVAEEVFARVGARCELSVREGAAVDPGTTVAKIRGPLRSLLLGERTALNLLCRLSGIATHTRRFVRAVEGHRAKILDTRKTTPLYRALEKYAVRTGGGVNHRMGLSDQVLVKENHIAAARAAGEATGFDSAVRLIGRRTPAGTVIGIEVTNLSELHIAFEVGPAYVLCDNFPLDDLRMAVRIRDEWPGESRPEIEASGGVTLENVAAVAATGVDRISIGALTHSAPVLDLSMKIVAD